MPPRAQGRSPPRLEGEGHDCRAGIVPDNPLHSLHPWRSDAGGTSPGMDEVERSRMPEPRAAPGAAAEGGGVDKQRIGEVSGCVVDFRKPIQLTIVEVTHQPSANDPAHVGETPESKLPRWARNAPSILRFPWYRADLPPFSHRHPARRAG